MKSVLSSIFDNWCYFCSYCYYFYFLKIKNKTSFPKRCTMYSDNFSYDQKLLLSSLLIIKKTENKKPKHKVKKNWIPWQSIVILKQH